MKLPDVNVLVGAVNEASAEHKVARAWLQAAFDAPVGVGLAWLALLGFICVTTQRAILPRPLGAEDALVTVRDWTQAPRAHRPSKRAA